MKDISYFLRMQVKMIPMMRPGKNSVQKSAAEIEPMVCATLCTTWTHSFEPAPPLKAEAKDAPVTHRIMLTMEPMSPGLKM